MPGCAAVRPGGGGVQDTGTAIVMGKRGQYVWTDGKDEEALSKGVFRAYTQTNLRCEEEASLLISQLLITH